MQPWRFVNLVVQPFKGKLRRLTDFSEQSDRHSACCFCFTACNLEFDFLFPNLYSGIAVGQMSC